MNRTLSDPTFLETTGFLDGQHDDVQRFTANAVGDVRDPAQRARLIFTAVGRARRLLARTGEGLQPETHLPAIRHHGATCEEQRRFRL
ncbi:hypothetical protein B1790_19635 [Mycobacterium sp. AT1]|nr:hypothetical protein B1790_19635 [Mycobacterium sp. AT1]